MSAESTTNSTAAARWLNEHYESGGILMDESARGNAVLPVMGIPLKEIYNRASGDYFGPALEDPAKYAKWVFVNVEAGDRGTRLRPHGPGVPGHGQEPLLQLSAIPGVLHANPPDL